MAMMSTSISYGFSAVGSTKVSKPCLPTFEISARESSDCDTLEAYMRGLVYTKRVAVAVSPTSDAWPWLDVSVGSVLLFSVYHFALLSIAGTALESVD
jgi:hypothetical protein